MPTWIDKLLKRPERKRHWYGFVSSGKTLHDAWTSKQARDISDKIKMMDALVQDSQISTALSYYATDATVPNSDGNIIWAVPQDGCTEDAANAVNDLFARWNINEYARSHILQLATYGNLYIPTTKLYNDDVSGRQVGVMIDNNTFRDEKFDIVPSTKLKPDHVLHLWYRGEPSGYLYKQSDSDDDMVVCPESAIIHFSLGGLVGDYTIDLALDDGGTKTYDIKFADPLMDNAVVPTRTLTLLEDSLLLSSFSKTVKFINVDCTDVEDESEIKLHLLEMKDALEQQLSLNTNTGDTQSFVNPQSPNNLIYLPRFNGNEPITITDLNMADTSESDTTLLDHFLNKKLSVLGIPKEALNFSSNEGLGGAGSVLSQRSALYANSLQRIESAYIAGWRQAANTYFVQRGLSGLCDQYILKMEPILTEMSTVLFERRDSALSQASTFLSVANDAGVSEDSDIREGLSEILSDAFPKLGSNVKSWELDREEASDEF